jgi:hypothetical protein
MLRDVFYYGNKPNVHPREKFAKDFNDAQRQATTEHFWIVNEFCDYTNFDWDFDFEFLSDDLVWTGEHINVWPSLYQKDSGTWLCNKKSSTIIVYRNDVDKLKRKNIKTSNWVVKGKIDESKFDFAWHPDPTEPPYIYQFPSQWNKTGGPRYHIDGATEVKYVNSQVAFRLADKRNWQVSEEYIIESFDFSWHPDDTDPPYIYQFGTQWQKTGGPCYIVPGSTQLKYINVIKAQRLPCMNNWIIPDNIDVSEFDFSWHPDDTDPAFIYEFGTQHQKTGGPVYNMPNATEKKYVDYQKAKALPQPKKFRVQNNYKIKDFDYSWHPDETEEAFVYVFGNQYYSAEKMPTIVYRVIGAREEKFINDIHAALDQDRTNWLIPDYVDDNDFDFSWVPDPGDPKDYIYEFPTEWNDRGGPKYVTPGTLILPNGKPLGTFKYMEGPKAKTKPIMSSWIVPDNIDVDSFDFSWVPHPDDPKDYVYEFGTQWNDRGGPRYINPGVVILPNGKPLGTFKYMDTPKAKLLPDTKNWYLPDYVDATKFDFSWRPHPDAPPYIYEFATVWNNRGGPKYIVPGATEYKYIEEIKAKLLPDTTNWQIPDYVDTTGFDFSWQPHPDESPYIYEFGTQWQKTGGPIYVAEGIARLPNGKPIGERKYIDVQRVRKLPEPEKFTTLNDYKISNFDYSWHPDDTETGYTYVFGNNYYSAEKMPTIQYGNGFKDNYKYVNDVVATLAPDKTHWLIPDNIDDSNFDFSWVPDPGDPDDYIYEFPTVWHDRGGPRYLNPDVVVLPNGKPMGTFKYVDAQKAKLLPDMTNWEVSKYVNKETFDFSWRPHPDAPPYIYEFATVWNNRGGPKYIVPGATDYSYVEHIKAKCKPSMENWLITAKLDVSDFDFSWRPHPDSPPYVYQFGTLENDMDGPVYFTPGNTGEIVKLHRVYKVIEGPEVVHEIVVNEYYIETTLDDLVKQHPEEIFWAKRKNIDYNNFNFNWRPNIVETAYELNYVHVFGSPESEITQTYFVSSKMWDKGHKDFKYVEQDKKADEEYLAELFVQPDIFFVDRGNKESQERFDQLKLRFVNVSKTRFLNSWVDTINRCVNRSNTELCWILNSELDYSNFDFKYYPNEWQIKMVHVFGTQWSHWGTTFMVNRDTFAEDTKYIKVIEHLKNLNFVKDRKAKATNNLYDIYVIDHGNIETDVVVARIKDKASGKTVHIIPYENSYLDTIKNIVKNIVLKKEHYIWITSSICDYTKFNFDYICDPFAKDNLHVFPSNNQKFGDTFLLDVNKTLEIINDMQILQQYHKINFASSIKTERLPAPVLYSEKDTHVDSLDIEFDFPYVILQTEDIKVVDEEPMCLWSQDTKNIVITTTGATRIIVPKEAKETIKKEFYDYPYIKTASKLIDSKPLDIVFLSNGEKCAEENYEHLLAVTKGLKNRVVRVDGVDGRVAAYHAAVLSSNTQWAFTVFAKLKINTKFDFSWQPDRLQIPKHYIFHAKNPVNGLEYGHQGMIAYNKRLTLANTGKGLDFTLDDPHETVQLLSGTANFNTDEYSTWRTAFREVIKLKSDYTDISQERLKVWLAKAKGKFAKDCLQGANDAVEYYDSVSGDIDQLKLSYEWEWLKDYYDKKYK